MVAYWINTFRNISDETRLQAYIAVAGTIMQDHGGRFLARGLPDAVYESAVRTRTVLIEFPSVAAAVGAYESAEYQAALQVLDGGAERDIRIIDGLPPVT